MGIVGVPEFIFYHSYLFGESTSQDAIFSSHGQQRASVARELLCGVELSGTPVMSGVGGVPSVPAVYESMYIYCTSVCTETCMNLCLCMSLSKKSNYMYTIIYVKNTTLTSNLESESVSIRPPSLQPL